MRNMKWFYVKSSVYTISFDVIYLIHKDCVIWLISICLYLLTSVCRRKTLYKAWNIQSEILHPREYYRFMWCFFIKHSLKDINELNWIKSYRPYRPMSLPQVYSVPSSEWPWCQHVSYTASRALSWQWRIKLICQF